MKSCSYCGAPLDNDALFCSNCGKKIEPQGKQCPRCGTIAEANSAYCAMCGMSLDSPKGFNVDPMQAHEETVSYDLEEEKDKTRWYVIGAVFIALLAYGSYCTFKHYYNTNNKESIQLSSEEESFFIDLVKRWDETHNCKEFDECGENNPYAETVKFYGMKMSGLDAHLKKVELLAAKPDFRQESQNIKVKKITEKYVICNFDKKVFSNGKSKYYPGCYLYFEDVGDGLWKIVQESDSITDHNLKRHR